MLGNPGAYKLTQQILCRRKIAKGRGGEGEGGKREKRKRREREDKEKTKKRKRGDVRCK